MTYPLCYGAPPQTTKVNSAHPRQSHWVTRKKLDQKTPNKTSISKLDKVKFQEVQSLKEGNTRPDKWF